MYTPRVLLLSPPPLCPHLMCYCSRFSAVCLLVSEGSRPGTFPSLLLSVSVVTERCYPSYSRSFAPRHAMGKRPRQDDAVPEGGAPRDSRCEAETDPNSGSDLSSTHSSAEDATFGFYVWKDVGVLLFHRLLQEIHGACARMADAFGRGKADQLEEDVSHLMRAIDLIGYVAMSHLGEREKGKVGPVLRAFFTSFEGGLRRCVSHSTEDMPSFCRALQRFLEEQGFPEEEDTGPITRCLVGYRQRTETLCYSYAERSTGVLSLLPRYDGDKRSEEEHASARQGYVVEVSIPHPHPEVNTAFYLTEPKKRKAVLDEYRIFSHPKKAATYGTEDFLVDEELVHRALVVLTHHLDSHGSLRGLSPYARFLLWGLLEKDDSAFESLCIRATVNEATKADLESLKVKLAWRLKAFHDVRVVAREAAQQIGWYAVSAQWRDQALQKLEDLEDNDWYMVSDVVRSGIPAAFPNGARSSTVRTLAMGVIRKMDKVHGQGNHIPPVGDVVESVLLPLLSAETPELKDYCLAAGSVDAKSAHWLRFVKRLKVALEGRFAEKHAPSCAQGVALSDRVVKTFVTPSMVFPLQCLAELFEMCAAARHASNGIEAFTKSFLSGSWDCEEDVLAYLLKREPTNTTLAVLVGICRLYKDLVTGIQLMLLDTALPTVLVTRILAESSPFVALGEDSYVYWKCLSGALEENDRFDDLLCLTVSSEPPRKEFPYTDASLARAPRVWPQDLAELVEEEKQCLAGMTEQGARPAV